MKKSTKQKILLIIRSEEEIKRFRAVLELIDCEVVSITNSKIVFQRIFEYPPDLVICENDMGDINGFQIFNQLKKYLLRKGIPFFLYMKHFDKDDIMIGLEMGMDNFIIAPIESTTLINKIEIHIQKISESRLFDKHQFDTYFESTPVAKFMVRNNRLEKINKAFCNLFNLSENAEQLPLVTEIFDITDSNELFYRKCMNGLIQSCYLKGVRSVQQMEQLFDIHFCNCENSEQGAIMVDVVPTNMFKNTSHSNVFAIHNSDFELTESGEKSEVVLFTLREEQVLKLSAQGLPIKQIAAILNVSNRTVEKHRANIMKKTNSNNIIEAIAFANHNDIFQPKTSLV